MTSYLPPSTLPWRTRILRRHAPPPVRGRSDFRGYRSCLRWEFGFSCAFCLLHESDLATAGVDGSGLMSIEHFIPVHSAEVSGNQYENCFYTCRFCNLSRGSLPVVNAQGLRILNPCEVAWGDFFELRGDEILPRDSADATYTHEIYDLNDPRKVALRRTRRENLTTVQAYLSESHDLLERAFENADPSMVDLAQELWRLANMAAKQRAQFAAVPVDAAECSCGAASLPEAFAEQLLPGFIAPHPRHFL